MKELIAKRPILYRGRMYEPGDKLPANDGMMVNAWIKAESAEWKTTERETPDDQGNTKQENPGGGQGAVDQVDAKKLAKMNKASLEKLASDMDVDISGAKTNPERAALIAAALEDRKAEGGDE